MRVRRDGTETERGRSAQGNKRNFTHSPRDDTTQRKEEQTGARTQQQSEGDFVCFFFKKKETKNGQQYPYSMNT